MSKQFNLFWGDSDDPIMFESLRKSFGEFSAVLERGTMADLAPRKVADIDIFRELKRRTRRPGTYHYFVLQDDIPRLTLTEVKPGLFMVEARRSPVIEFSPSKEKEGVMLPRFGGHPNTTEGGGHDAEKDTSSVCARIQTTNG